MSRPGEKSPNAEPEPVECEGHISPLHESFLANRYSAETVEKAVRLFKAIGDPERLGLLSLLAGREACVSELSEGTNAELSTVSQRLRLLRAEGLVARRRAGKHIYYSLADHHVTELIQSALEHSSEKPEGPAARRSE